MKFYHYGLLPLYLLLCSWQLITYILNYGLPNLSRNIPVSCTITIGLTEIAYIAYIALLVYLLIKFKERNLKVYKLNKAALFLFPLVTQISTIITQVIFYELNYPTNVSLLSYLIVYALLFLPFFLPQVIYFKKRKDMFEDWWDL